MPVVREKEVDLLVFIDDSEANVIGARECGLHAVWAKDKSHEIAVSELEALLL